MTTSSHPQTAASSWASLPWKTRISLTVLSKVTDAARRSNGTVNRRLLGFFDFRSSPTPSAPHKGVTTSDVTVDATRNLWFRLFVPSSSSSTTSFSSLPVIVFFHGGGFSFLSADAFAYDAVCRRFSRRLPAVVVSVNYRLSPEHRHPCQYDDGLDVLKYLSQNRDALPAAADLSRCFLAGDSAGGNIAHHVAVRAGREQLQKVNLVGLISIQPFFGGEERTESELRLEGAPLVSMKRTDWAWKVFLPAGSTRDHEAANVTKSDISGVEYPSTVVFVGGFDPLRDWQMRYCEWLRKCGKEAKVIEYPNAVHAFYLFPELPEAEQLVSQVKDFVASRII